MTEKWVIKTFVNKNKTCLAKVPESFEKDFDELLVCAAQAANSQPTGTSTPLEFPSGACHTCGKTTSDMDFLCEDCQ